MCLSKARDFTERVKHFMIIEILIVSEDIKRFNKESEVEINGGKTYVMSNITV